MKSKITISLCILLLFTACGAKMQENYSDKDLPKQRELTASPSDPLSMNMNNETISQEARITWQLTPVYSAVTNEESAYLKVNGPQTIIYPFVWDRYPNIDRDPTDKEIGFAVPLSNYQAIWLDDVDFDGDGKNEVFLKLVSSEGFQVGYLFKNNGTSAIRIFMVESLGELTLRTDPYSDTPPQIENEEPVGTEIKTSFYEYDPSSKTIVLTSSTISQQVNTQASKESTRLRGLSLTEQENFIKGPWIKITSGEEADQDNEPASNKRFIVYFSPEDRQIIFGQTDMLEIYEWNNSTKSYNGLYLAARNSQIEHIRNNLYVQFENNNEISLKATGSDISWTGLYRRMTNQEKEFSTERAQSIAYPQSNFSGLYKSGSGEEYNFKYPLFTLTNNNENLSGTYAHFKMNNEDFLELRFLDNRGLASKKQSYSIKLSERTENGRLIRSIQLIPGHFVLWGFEPAQDRSLYLEQIEFINK